MYKKKSIFVFLVCLMFFSTLFMAQAEVIEIGDFQFNVYDINSNYQAMDFACDRGKVVTKDGVKLLVVQNKQNKEGIIDIKGNVIVPIKYDDIISFYDEYVLVSINDYIGVFNLETEKFVLEPNQYNFVSRGIGYFIGSNRDGSSYDLDNNFKPLPFNVETKFEDFYIVRENELQSIYRTDKTKLTSNQYELIDGININGSVYFRVSVNQKYGLLDNEGKVLLQPKYNYFTIDTKANFIKLQDSKGNISIYNYKNNKSDQEFDAIAKKYKVFNEYDNSSYFFKSIYKSGLMDHNYKIIEQINTRNVSLRYHNGLYEICGKSSDQYLATYQYSNAKGTKRSKTYDYADDSFLSDCEYIVVNKFNKRPTHYEEYTGWGLHKINFYHKDELIKPNYGIINSGGKEIIPCIYDRILDYNQRLAGLFVVKKDGKTGLINEKNEVIIPLVYDRVIALGTYDDGNTICAFEKDGKYGILNNKGEEIVAFVLEKNDFYLKDDRIILTIDGLTGAINTKGEPIIPFIYHGAQNKEFRNGLGLFFKGSNRFVEDPFLGRKVEIYVPEVLSKNNDLIIPANELFSVSGDCSILIRKTANRICIYELVNN